MVLESFINPFKAVKHPWEMFLLGAIYNSIAFFLALIIKDNASLLMVFFTTISCVPLLYSTIKMEEEYDIKTKNESKILKEHGKVLYFLLLLFLGVVVSVALWYLLLPIVLNFLSSHIPSLFHFPASYIETTQTNLFGAQHNAINAINNGITGQITAKIDSFLEIFGKNMWVLVLCLVFSFLYGFGAIFILIWNAAVVGVAIGKLLSQNFTFAFLRFFVHGPIEVAAYFIAGLAGGIISVAVIKHDFGTKRFSHVLLDSVLLWIIAIFLIFIAAIVEVWISPLLF